MAREQVKCPTTDEWLGFWYVVCIEVWWNTPGLYQKIEFKVSAIWMEL